MATHDPSPADDPAADPNPAGAHSADSKLPDRKTPLQISTNRQAELLSELARLFQSRARTQQQIEADYVQEKQTALSEFGDSLQRESTAHEDDVDRLNANYNDRLATARHVFEQAAQKLEAQRGEHLQEVESKVAESLEIAELTWRQTVEMAEANYGQDSQLAETVAAQAKATTTTTTEQFGWLKSQVEALLRRRGTAALVAAAEPLGEKAAAATLLHEYGKTARQLVNRTSELSSWFWVRYVDEGWPVLVGIGLFLLALAGTGTVFGWGTPAWFVVSAILAAVVALASRLIANAIVKQRSAPLVREIQQLLATAAQQIANAQSMVAIEHDERKKQLSARRDSQVANAAKVYEEAKSETLHRQQEAKEALELRIAQRAAELKRTWDEAAAACRQKFPPLIEQRKALFANLRERLEDDRQQRLRQAADHFNRRWDELEEQWRGGTQAIFSAIDSMRAYCQSRFHAWDSMDWATWEPDSRNVAAIPFGNYSIDLAGLEGGLPETPRLKIDRGVLQVPAVVAFPESPSLLIEAEHQGRDRAVGILQNLMLRMLMSLPAGKVRFTIIDPIGLGQNFSAFMHLADYDERLVTSRIWTEASHISQRLSDLTEHMENVIQKYLRNEFESIQAYNQMAGEVAEPFQVLVVANFPANFAEDSARRLLSIASSGARCGVYTLITADTKMKMPSNFDLADLEAQANTLVWEQNHFRWRRPDLHPFPLETDAPPTDNIATQAIQAAGRHAKDANRVEVPFRSVVPPRDEWWTHDSRHEITVPLGRAGATQMQQMQLGKGTSQHVLIAGKTGSGKSTLMHALVTNLAIHYSPNELQFYLIDFKKGVEFKTYAEFGLPHARVIAIESEREFGLSVLQRMDEELQQRGERFRAAGVQSLAGFRDAHPDELMPRLLLLVDEFQEFFVKDDKISHDASLLLDRLVRQGRAFGIHVVLGSQTLAGAYSLARSTIGQMAVRIALQCSESDAHLILSEENTAARLLSRPGEAIYNNANGLFEGNHPFQIVWLPDHEREDYLQQLSRMAADRHLQSPAPIVFEGNVAADLRSNHLLNRVLQQPPVAGQTFPACAWLGAAIAIKDPTDVVFRRQSGNHLLVVGQDEEMAAGILTSSIVGLAASHPLRTGNDARRAAKFYVLDGGGFDSAELNFGARLRRRLPLDLDVIETTRVESTIREIADEVTRRIDASDLQNESIFVCIYNLARFRQLRKLVDDFGLTSFGGDEPRDAAQSFVQIIKEGPNVGVHLLMWCDTYNNVTRWLDRTALRDVAWRVLFQMSATDSSNLMDSAAASQLGVNRAIVYSDERGEFEKFRPYGVPDAEFLDSVSQMLG